MQVHQQIPELSQEGECAGGTVYELFARAAGGNRAFDDERAILAGFCPAPFEYAMDTRVRWDLKKTFYRAGIGTRADERLLGALAE
jgi:hypothetical protein